MKPILPLLFTLLLASPSLAVETVFSQFFSTVAGTVQEDGDAKYTLNVGSNSWKCIDVNSAAARLNFQWNGQGGNQHRVGCQYVMRGDLSGGFATAETMLAVWRTDYLANTPYAGTSAHSHVTGVVSEFSTGKYRITDEDDGKVYDIMLPVSVHGDAGKLADAVSSGDAITLGGTIGFRGSGATQENYFVVDDFVD